MIFAMSNQPDSGDDIDADERAEQNEWLRQFEANFDKDIQTLITEGKIEKPPTTQARKKLLAAAAARKADLTSLDEIIKDTCPRMMSATWRDEERETNKYFRKERDHWDKENQRGKYAPAIDVSGLIPVRKLGEANATEKQKSYLQQLGVTDQRLIANLSKSQASAAIKVALTKREKSGCGPLTIVVSVLVVLFLLWMLLASRS